MKFAVSIILCFFLLPGCAYQEAYRQYAVSQAEMANAAGPIVSFHQNGALASVGNPMIAMAMMQMKEPKDGWTQFFDWLKFATPFGAMYGIVGAMANAAQGHTTNVTGNSNLTGNTAGPSGAASSWASPVTTTTVTEINGGEGSIRQ
jgi:hypothetical protein